MDENDILIVDASKEFKIKIEFNKKIKDIDGSYIKANNLNLKHLYIVETTSQVSHLRDELKAGLSEVMNQLENIFSQISSIQLGLGNGLERLSTQWLRLDLVKRGYNNVNLEISKKIRDPLFFI